MNKFHFITTILAATLLLLLHNLAAADTSKPSPHSVITEGCTEVGGGFIISRVVCTNPELEPLIWGSPRSSGGDQYGFQGTLPSPAYAGYCGDGRVLVWTAHEGFWGNGPDGKVDNDRFRSNAIHWLLDGGARVGMSTGHGEMLNSQKLSVALRRWMDEAGLSYANVPDTLTINTLADVDLLVVGNTWNEFSPAEEAVIVDWVRHGGALLAIGLGWAYYQYNDDPLGENYAINRLGKHFGWKSVSGTILDPATPNGEPRQPSFAIRPLSEYTPAEIVVLTSGVDDLSSIPLLATANPQNIYVAVGEKTGIQFPSDTWADFPDPVAAVELLDRVYAVQTELISGANPPYGGSKIWYISKEDPAGRYYMHSGNPIVMKTKAARDTAHTMNTTGRCGWGAAHELGHNMVISACGNLFVHEGTAEEWCNVFTTWTFMQLGWPERAGSFDEGHTYHAEAEPDFSHLTSNSWVLLGCLELVWSRYGWEGMQVFLTKAATDTANGLTNRGNDERTAYWVENMSHAYGLDFADLIAHWGFPVSKDTRTITGQYPPLDSEW